MQDSKINIKHISALYRDIKTIARYQNYFNLLFLAGVVIPMLFIYTLQSNI